VLFLALVLIFRYISLGSVASAALLPFSAMGFLGARFCIPLLPVDARTPADPRWLMLAWTVLSLLVIRAHGSNIQRLLQGTESKLWGGPKATEGSTHV
jgi:glycerol-3-phosphate acyltransferase PlsY